MDNKENELKVGEYIKDFTAKMIDSDLNEKDFVLSQIKKPVILFFYPKDNTPGCTLEAKAFSSKLEDFRSFGVEVFGMSGDRSDSHEKFIQGCDLKLPLITDSDNIIANTCGLVKPKSLFGIKYNSVSRSTFFIDVDLKIIQIWQDVSVFSHAGEVLSFVQKYMGK